jgi:hypothetical protein
MSTINLMIDSEPLRMMAQPHGQQATEVEELRARIDRTLAHV